MAVEAEKLRARLTEWQAYIEQPQTPLQIAPGEPEAATFAWDASAQQERSTLTNGNTAAGAHLTREEAGNSDLAEHFESQLAEIQAQLESERIRAQQLTEKLAQEVIRSRHQRPDIPFAPPQERKIYRPAAPKREAPVQEHGIKSIQLFIIVLLIAGFCSLMAVAFAK